MKLKYILICFFIYSHGSLACEMVSPARHINPDSTEGGLVSSKAKVAPSAYIGYNVKVCDSAWVDGNAKVLDQAMIKGNAWVREFSTVKDRAVIDEHAVLWGNQGFPVLVEGDAHIFGNARIMAGTKISDQSRVYGNVSLTSSQVMGKARVCEKFDLKNETLGDDYFCPQGAYTISNTDVELLSYDLEKINPMKGILKFRFNGYPIVEDASKFKVWLNEELLDSLSIDVRKGTLEVNSYGVELDGINKVALEGVDIYGKVIFLEETEFILGSGVKELTLGEDKGIQDPGLEAKVFYTYDSRTFTGDFEYINGGIRLLNIPQGTIQDDIGVDISGVGDLLYFSDSYNSISSMPSEIDVYSYPEFIDNDLSLTGNLANWDVNHPELVSSESAGDSTHARLYAPEVGSLIVGKRVRLSDSDGGLRLEFSLPSPNKLLVGPLATLEVVIISLLDKRLERRVYQAGVDSITEDHLTIGSLNKGGDYIVFLRLSGAGWKTNENYVLKRASKPKATLTFNPYHFEVENGGEKFQESVLPETEFSEIANCFDNKYKVRTANFKHYFDDDFKFFSAGDLKNLASHIKMNRIFGEMTGTNILRKNLTLTLVVFQNGVKFGEFPLSKCAKEFLELDKSKKKFHYGRRINFVSYLFAIPFQSLKFLDVSTGSKVKIALKALWLDEDDIVQSLLSDEKELRILVSTNRGKKIFGGLDTYDTPRYGMLRTGGDKWLLPSVSRKTEEILDANPSWGLNDGSKLNGGKFKPHKEHKTGTDIDIGNDFNFLSIESFANVDESKRKKIWLNQLSQIERFLSNVQDDYPYFENIFLTRELTLIDKKTDEKVVKIDPRFVDSYFENRCFNGRFISLRMNKEDRSLLTHSTGHHDHLHISFNDVEDVSGAITLIKSLEPSKETYSFDRIAITYDANKLKLSPHDNKDSLFKDKAILWRVQDGEGYGNFDLQIDYGFWQNGLVKYNHERPTFNSSNIYWLYATIADTTNGGCVEYKAKFKINDDKKINVIEVL
ncbi:MAG: hypothetical protein WDA09_06420 [Bacteriovoracaceae bacterium]